MDDDQSNSFLHDGEMELIKIKIVFICIFVPYLEENEIFFANILASEELDQFLRIVLANFVLVTFEFRFEIELQK